MLYADDRDWGARIAAVKELVHDTEIRRLDTGDYVFGDVGIEVKSLNDLLSSVWDNGRFWKQLEVMKATYPNCLLLVEGFEDNATKTRRVDGKVERMPMNESEIKTVRSIETSVLMSWGMPFIQTKNHFDTARRISELYAKYSKEKSSGPPKAAVKKSKKPEEIRLEMLQCIENCGPVLAHRILEEYNFSELSTIDSPSVYTSHVVGMRKEVADSLVKVFVKNE